MFIQICKISKHPSISPLFRGDSFLDDSQIELRLIPILHIIIVLIS